MSVYGIEKGFDIHLALLAGSVLIHLDEAAGKAELFMTVFNEMKGKKVQIEYMDLQYSKPFVRLRQQAQ